MTRVIDGVRVLTLDEWKKLPAVQELNEQLGAEECEECDGAGEHTCECGHEHDCGYCDGTGQRGGVDLEVLYRNELKEELQKLVLWREGLPIPAKK